jgi:hypothetical protein
VLNFNGTINPRQMRFNLDLACKSFGIVSSKTEGMDGRAVETLYRAGRHEDIATYCLEDVRATCELYLKLEKTLLQFEMSFRDAEERASRRKTAAEQLRSQTPRSTSRPSWSQVTETSLTLTSALDAAEEEVVTAKHQAIVLEKLVSDTARRRDLASSPPLTGTQAGRLRASRRDAGAPLQCRT